MKKNVRLPSHVKPSNYKLQIKPNLGNFTFEGRESVLITLSKSSPSIVLHAKELEVFDAEYKAKSAKYKIKKIDYDAKAETVTFTFFSKLPKGKGELSLGFKGLLNDKMRGFYRSRYMHEGKEKHIATTQFEATDARRAFPCFDEPNAKAVFDITIVVPEGLKAISNTVESSIAEHEGGYKAIRFEPSPKMSTYLVAFIVGDFEHIQGKTKKGVTVRVFVTPGKKHQAKFALGCAIKSLEFYENYFKVPYPLPILDLIAIPDFSHGAMENWGAVTYRESALLVDPENSSASNKQWVALVIAHELAHQWFGNLVTMDWWTDLWLNEGFASYIEYLAVDHLFPQWDIWTQFAYNDLGIALDLDSLKSTHSIEVKVHHPDEIGEIFDEVSYSKGASVIRMLADYLGQNDFRNGLRYYLNRYKYKNAKTKDLWNAFKKVSKKPVDKMMRNWTKKPGYPLVKIVDKPNSFRLIQSRYFSSPISKQQIKDRTVWQIPLTFVTNQKKDLKPIVLVGNSLEILKPQGAWVKFNAGESSFIRTDYPAQILEKLHSAVKNKTLRPLDRLGLIRDAFALAESGDLPTTQAMELARHYINELDFTVWVELISGFGTINHLLFGQKSFADFQVYGRSILTKVILEVGWSAKKNEPHTHSLLRSLVLQAAGGFGHVPTLKKAQEIFLNWQMKGKKVPADLRGVVYNLAAGQGNEKTHAFLKKAYVNESLHEEKNRIGRALGQFKDDRLVKKTLEFALSPEVRYQDTASLFMSAWSNPHGRDAAWNFTKKNWKALLERFPSSGHMLSRFIKPASVFYSRQKAREIKEFFKKNTAPGAKRAVEQTLEKINSNSEWLKRDLRKIERWLKNSV